MFKSILKWWKNQFLAEGESQIKYQEDDSVKAVLPELPENVLMKKEYYVSNWSGLPYSSCTKLGIDTFTLYNDNNEEHKKQFNTPVVTLLKVIKQAFDEDSIYFPTKDLNTNSVSVKYKQKVLLHLVFNTELQCSRFSEDLVYSYGVVEFTESLDFLTITERTWVSEYFHYRLRTLCEENEQVRRVATELELQELLK